MEKVGVWILVFLMVLLIGIINAQEEWFEETLYSNCYDIYGVEIKDCIDDDWCCPYGCSWGEDNDCFDACEIECGECECESELGSLFSFESIKSLSDISIYFCFFYPYFLAFKSHFF